MNRQAKSALESLVLTLRHKLEEEIAIGLKRYGFAGERWLPLERLPHIERDDAAAADHFRLAASLEQHLRRIGAAPDRATPAQRAEAVAWFVREVAFTHLNRLVALKCLEARGLIPEIITTRDAYGGRARAHYEYRFDHPAEAAALDDALSASIRDAIHTAHTYLKAQTPRLGLSKNPTDYDLDVQLVNLMQSSPWKAARPAWRSSWAWSARCWASR